MTGRRTTTVSETTGAGLSITTGAQSGTRTCELPAHSLELRYSEVADNRRPRPARQELGHLLHPRSLYACTLFPCLSPALASKRGNPLLGPCRLLTLCCGWRQKVTPVGPGARSCQIGRASASITPH